MKISANPAVKILPGTVRNINRKFEVNLSKKEKRFFAGMYPENKNEIMEYHFYGKTGKITGVYLGSKIDKRG